MYRNPRPRLAVPMMCTACTLLLTGCVAALPALLPSAGVAVGKALSDKPKTQLVALQVNVDEPGDNQLKCPELQSETQKMDHVIANAGVIEVPTQPEETDFKTKVINVGTEASKTLAANALGGGAGGGLASGVASQNAQAAGQNAQLTEMKLRIQASVAVTNAQKRNEKLAKLQKQRKCA